MLLRHPIAALARRAHQDDSASGSSMKVHPINKKKIPDAVHLLLEAIGEDPDREGLCVTLDLSDARGVPE